MRLFDILGPVMVGPSSSHTAGAVRIGLTARKLLGDRPVHADISLHGSFALTGHGHGTDCALIAGLLGMQPDDLRIPNAYDEANRAGMAYSFHTVELRDANPNTALYMLGLSLAVGVVQINVSLAMKGYLLVKRDKDVIGLFNEVISWFSILIGIILLALNMLLKLADGFKIAGIVFMVVGVLLILVLGGRGKKGIKKIFGGFSQLYGGVNFFSDILSYSRLFGLGLSTAVIGMVVNEICKVIINILTFNGISVLGVIVAIPIFAVGHVFNIAINTLGTYIHDARLQFIEFFGTFFEGGGHDFKPLGSNTKYNYIEK